MSLAIPVAAGVWLYNEQVNAVKFFGILLAMAAVTFSSWKSETKSESKKHGKSWLFPLIIFVGSGFLDTSMKYVETQVLSPALTSIFLLLLFLTAGSIGIGILTTGLVLGKMKFHYRNLLGGIVLGVPNYFSIYFLLEALSTSGMDSTVIFPIMNVGTVLLSAVSAIVMFREKLSVLNYLGLGLSIAAILMIAFA
jgi:multidrug transporter EmrE-like cation transporter